MFKFLRKYNKWILAVGGTLLLIVFLGGQAIQSLFESAGAGGATIATVRGEEVSRRDWARIQEEVSLLRDVGLSLPYIGPVDDPEHWYLLTLEAEQAGAIGGVVTAGDPQDVANMARLTGRSELFVAETMARANGVATLVRGYLSASKLSDRRLRHFANKRMRGVRAEIVVIKADAESIDYEPTEDELQEQFAKFKSVRPGEGAMGMGYMLPNRVQVEWLSVPVEIVREVVRTGDRFNRIEQIKHWQRLNGTNGLPAFDAAATAVPEAVKEDLLNSLTEQMLDDIAKFAHGQLRARQLAHLTEEEGYYALPDDWASKRLDFLSLAQSIQDRFGIATPTYRAPSEWLDGLALDALEGIGTAATDEYGSPVRFRALVESTRELTEHPAHPKVQRGVAVLPLRELAGKDGAVYVFRITDVDPAREPKNVSEIRDQLVRDLRLIKAYEQLLAAQADIEKLAEEQGLLAVAIEHETAVQRLTTVTLTDPNLLLQLAQQGFGIRSLPTRLPVIGNDDETVKKILEYAERFSDGTIVSGLPEGDRITVVSSEKGLAVLVVRLAELLPVSEQTYSQLAGGVAQGLQEMIISEELPLTEDRQLLAAFTFEELAKRHDFAFTAPPTSEEDDEADESRDALPAGASAAADSG